MCWKGLQADTQYCRGPVMAVKPHGSQQFAQAAPYLVHWSKQWSMSAFGLCPLKNCPLEENMMLSCGWFAWGNSHFTHLILKGIFKSTADIDAKCILFDLFADELKEKLQDFVSETNSQHPGFIKIVRHTRQEGLIRSRVSGWRAATAPVVALFDAHVEFNVGWWVTHKCSVKWY